MYLEISMIFRNVSIHTQEPQTGQVHDELWELDLGKMEWTLIQVMHVGKLALVARYSTCASESAGACLDCSDI